MPSEEQPILPDEPTLFKPCPECDGWLKAKPQDFNPVGPGFYKKTTVWNCTVCDCGDVDRAEWVSKYEYEERNDVYE